MFIPLGQIGLGELTDEEKRDFIEFLNAQMREEELGEAKPIHDNEIRKESWEAFGNTLNVIAAIQVAFAVGKSKPVRWFYNQSLAWMKKTGKNISKMPQVEKMLEFMEKNKH